MSQPQISANKTWSSTKEMVSYRASQGTARRCVAASNSVAAMSADETSSSTKEMVSYRASQGTARRALLRAIMFRWGAGRCGADEPSPDVS